MPALQSSLPWRPLAERDLASLKSRIDGVFSVWLSDWFSEPSLTLSKGRYLSTVAADSACSSTSCQEFGNGLWVRILDQGRDQLVAQALDFQFAARSGESVQVRSMLESFGMRLLQDLAQKLRTCFQIGEPDHGVGATAEPRAFKQGGASFDLQGANQETLLSILLPYELAAKQIPSPVADARSGGLTSRKAALIDSVVSLHAKLGRAELTLPDLSGLALGDVIRLDQKINQDLAICINGSEQAVARGMLHESTESSASMVLQLTSVSIN
ncbi:flagellar motor switch protein FliM [Paraherbaspirillum soli]|uniref:FliM/FliN family flagellar motor C-terminal domain-containing protein n=1 Tax=Paraherbaspirillum soli TaxID=631222 RepID=A0ABW0MEV8_9BURK